MRLLLDTHIWLWMITSPARLSSTVRAALERPETALHLSAASSWEIAIKYQLGKLPLPEPPDRFIPARLVRDGITPLVVTHEHAAAVASLPRLHDDPFDRLLIAQAQIEGMTLVTADGKLGGYGVSTLS